MTTAGTHTYNLREHNERCPDISKVWSFCTTLRDDGVGEAAINGLARGMGVGRCSAPIAQRIMTVVCIASDVRAWPI